MHDKNVPHQILAHHNTAIMKDNEVMKLIVFSFQCPQCNGARLEMSLVGQDSSGSRMRKTQTCDVISYEVKIRLTYDFPQSSTSRLFLSETLHFVLVI